MVLIEAGLVLDFLSGYVDAETLLVGIERQRIPRYRVQGGAHSKKAAFGQHGVRNPAAANVNAHAWASSSENIVTVTSEEPLTAVLRGGSNDARGVVI